MRLYELELIITDHAHLRYCERVEDIQREELKRQVESHIQRRDYRRSDDFVHVDGVWWYVEVTDAKLKLVSCYGRMNMDIPAALAWAKIHKDRIVIPDA